MIIDLILTTDYTASEEAKVKRKIESCMKRISSAISRQSYIQTLRDDYLKGAFGEFMCRQIALQIGEPDHWSNEVSRLLGHVLSHSDPEKTKVKGCKDRDAANREAVQDLIPGLLQTKVTFAKSKVAGYYPKKLKKAYRLNFDNEEQFRLMLEEFLPSFLKYLKS